MGNDDDSDAGNAIVLDNGMLHSLSVPGWFFVQWEMTMTGCVLDYTAPETIKRELTLCFPIFAAKPVLSPFFLENPTPTCGFGPDRGLKPHFCAKLGGIYPLGKPGFGPGTRFPGNPGAWVCGLHLLSGSAPLLGSHPPHPVPLAFFKLSVGFHGLVNPSLLPGR